MALFLFALLDPSAEACTLADERAVLVNEVFSDPLGADAGREWIELTLDVGERDPADLEGWSILAGTSAPVAGPGLPPTWLEPDQHLVVTARDLPTLGNAGSGSADVIQLVDCEGQVADTVVYGGPNTDRFVDDSGATAVSLAPAPPAGASIGRSPDGVDTDLAGEDFAIFDVPSPGAPNPGPDPCEPGSGVVLNELLVNPAGADAPFEMVELFATTGPVDLTGWALVAVTRSDRHAQIELPDDTTVDGFLVVGGPGVPEATVVVELGLGNGDGTDGVRLVNCDGNVVDTVVYGDPGNEDGIADDQGFVAEPYGAPGEDESLARRADGVDTDQPRDWTVRPSPSPGVSNALAGGDTVATTGCQSPPDVRPAPRPREPTGCGTVPAGVTWGFAALVALSRRRSTSRRSAGR